MIYFSIRSDRKFIEDYYESARTYLTEKDREFSGGSVDEINSHYQLVSNLREKLARGLPRVKRLASIFAIPVIALDPNTQVQYHAFTTILNNDARGIIEDRQKLDLLNETMGACLEVERSQFWKLINPLYWVTESIAKILRIPFWLLETAGFKSDSFEKGLAGSVIRLIELIAIILLLLYFGFNESELKEVIKSMLNNV